MEEEKKDNTKAGMRRALNVRDILNKKYDVFPQDWVIAPGSGKLLATVDL